MTITLETIKAQLDVIQKNQEEILNRIDRNNNANLIAHAQTQHRVQEHQLIGVKSNSKETKSRNTRKSKYTNSMHMFYNEGHQPDFKEIWAAIPTASIEEEKKTNASELSKYSPEEYNRRFNQIVYKKLMTKNLKTVLRKIFTNKYKS